MTQGCLSSILLLIIPSFHIKYCTNQSLVVFSTGLAWSPKPQLDTKGQLTSKRKNWSTPRMKRETNHSFYYPLTMFPISTTICKPSIKTKHTIATLAISAANCWVERFWWRKLSSFKCSNHLNSWEKQHYFEISSRKRELKNLQANKSIFLF